MRLGNGRLPIARSQNDTASAHHAPGSRVNLPEPI